MKSKSTMPDLCTLELFDSCVTLGRFSSEICIPDAPSLLAIMDRYRIKEALVHDYHARWIHPMDNGNRRLLDAIRGQPRLHPIWVLDPPLEPGPGEAEALVGRMRDAGVGAARLRIRGKGSLPWVWEDLLGALESHRIPCFFDYGAMDSTLSELSDPDVEALRAMALAHPALPIVLSHAMGGLGMHPGVAYLVRRVPNLYLDISGILEYWRDAARDVGPERVLFATAVPFTDPGVLISNVQYARGFSVEDKRLICGDNLRRLLGGAR
jgi:predicted TIM-barrel fold metal-dependent hydrolase